MQKHLTVLLTVALYLPTGSANTMLSGQEVSEANNLVKDLKGLNSKSGSTVLYVPTALVLSTFYFPLKYNRKILMLNS